MFDFILFFFKFFVANRLVFSFISRFKNLIFAQEAVGNLGEGREIAGSDGLREETVSRGG